MSFSPPPPPPPPPPLLYPIPMAEQQPTFIDNTNTHQRSSSHSSFSMDTLKPSILIIILILSITFLLSISLCLLLRHLNRRCLRHLSPPPPPSSYTSQPLPASSADSRRHSSRRVSPETLPSSLLHSLPIFTFSSVTRRATNSSQISGDCAVCLCKFEPHDQLRLLPLCCHAFHAHCIDTWLLSNQTCPLCRSPLYASDSDLMKVLLASSSSHAATVATTDTIGSNGDNSFRLEIGSVSRRQAASDSSERRSFSIGSFDYVVDEESEVAMNHAHQRNGSEKEDVIGGADAAQPQPFLAADVGTNSRSWLKEYVDRLSASLSSRANSFRSSGRFFTGSSRRSEVLGAGELELEANRVGEEISELFRWFSGV